MMHTYFVDGITCENCVQSIKSSLLKVENVSSVEVSKASGLVTINMEKHIALNVLQNALEKNIKFQPRTIMNQ